MNDPQDLLYTNSFINTEIINENQINEQTKTYDRFIKYENEQNTENTNNTIKYINNDDNESDPINIQKTIHQPFPIDNNKNNYPMFDPLLKDISKTVYTKLKDSVINIDAGFRNPIYYPLTSKFKVNLPYTLNNIHQIEIFNINIPNFLKSVNAMQNNFSWQYFSDYYINTDISYNLLPFPDSLNRRFYAYPDIKYSTYKIPFSVLENDQKYDPSNFLTYQTNIQPGNYTLDELIREIEKSAADVLHGNNRNILLQDKDVNKYDVFKTFSINFSLNTQVDPNLEAGVVKYSLI